MKRYFVIVLHYFKIRKHNSLSCHSFENIEESMTLLDLKPGQVAVIKDFISSELELKLMEMGCIPGEKVIVEQVAPLGDPISIRIAGYSLSLRKNEANQIIVEL